MKNQNAERNQIRLISAQSGDLLPFLGELYDFRELLSFLVWKDIKVQFAQTVLGFGWLVLRPLLNIGILTLVFGKIAKMPSDGTPYLLFALAGMLAWSYFSGAVSKASASLVGNSALVTKVYFPRIYIPISFTLSALVEFVVTFVIFILVSTFVYGRAPTAAMMLFPIPLVLLLLTTIGASLWLAALSVDFRDVRHASQYLLQLLMFAAPIIWPLSLLRTHWGAFGESLIGWYAFYPLVGVIEGFRHALLGTGDMPWDYLAAGYSSALVLTVSGFMYFRRRERLLADYV